MSFKKFALAWVFVNAVVALALYVTPNAGEYFDYVMGMLIGGFTAFWIISERKGE